MIDLSLGSLIAYVVFTLIGIIIGFTLSRNSSKGNALYDQAVDRAERAEEQLREWRASVKNKKE